MKRTIVPFENFIEKVKKMDQWDLTCLMIRQNSYTTDEMRKNIEVLKRLNLEEKKKAKKGMDALRELCIEMIKVIEIDTMEDAEIVE